LGQLNRKRLDYSKGRRKKGIVDEEEVNRIIRRMPLGMLATVSTDPKQEGNFLDRSCAASA
jgi:hypothetical protein